MEVMKNETVFERHFVSVGIYGACSGGSVCFELSVPDDSFVGVCAAFWLDCCVHVPRLLLRGDMMLYLCLFVWALAIFGGGSKGKPPPMGKE